MVIENLKEDDMDFKVFIRNVANFPKVGIISRDITPLFESPEAFKKAIEYMVAPWKGRISAVTALEARGFLFGAPIALKLGVPFVPIRKEGKLPSFTESVEYKMESGTGVLQVHADAFKKYMRVLVVDDLLVTGATAKAACTLVERLGAEVAGCAFAIEICDLKGREALRGYSIETLVKY